MRVRGRAVITLMGLTALAAYSLGRHDAPSGSQPPDLVLSTAPAIEKPVALVTAPSPAVLSPAPTPPPPTANTSPAPAPKPSAPQPDAKRKTEVALTAAAIAAIIVQASRDQYYRTGHPCACPEDRTRNGQACGGRSTYSRPGGAAPLCYPGDVTQAMIEEYRRTAGAGTRAAR
jgi:hypothetical protein